MKKTVLITGVSRGIGAALANVFLENDYRVIGACRSSMGIATQHPDFEHILLDLSDIHSIQALETHIRTKGAGFDMIINNAGIGPDLDTNKPEPGSFQDTFAVNVTGAVFLTEMLLPFVNKGGKIIQISSKMGSIGVCEQDDSVAYRMSKAALNMYVKILTNRLKSTHSVASIHPGWVRTSISPNNIYGRLSAEESAEKIFHFVTSNFKSGVFWNVESWSACPW